VTAPTHLPLPEDAQVGTLDEETRSLVAAGWRLRARNELSTSTVFASITRSLVGLRAPHAVVLQAAKAVADEVRHAEICAQVARTYEPDGAPVAPSPVVDAPPIDGREEHELAGFLYAVMQSCINEGVATVYLQRSLAEAQYALVRAAVRDILQDEIHHARLGWALLASEAMRAAWRPAVAEALPNLLERVAVVWIAARDLPEIPAGHGSVRCSEMPDVVRSAYDELVLPGFDVVGIDSRSGRAWCAGWSW
jgi:hypothetical protein